MSWLGDTFKKVVQSPLAWFANPALALGGASIAGGLGLGGDPNADYNRMQIELARENMAMQKEFAQHGLRWRVDDAVAAGLHPLAALGASGSSFSNVSMPLFEKDTSARDWSRDVVGRMGQDILRSRLAAATHEEKMAAAADIRARNANASLMEEQAADLRQLRLERESKLSLMPNMYTSYVDDQGRVHRILTPEAAMGIQADSFGPMKQGFQNLGRDIFGRQSAPFWGAFKRAGRRLMFMD